MSLTSKRKMTPKQTCAKERWLNLLSTNPSTKLGNSAGTTVLSAHASNKTLAAILFLTVFGIFATALFVILCSKITKKEQYDSVKGTIY
ncbi:UNVERIFIED_CONTAM: hypothetical protein NCL1_13520 [Trichonephila clavipes]